MKEHAQWNIVNIWANTPIVHAYDSPEPEDIQELQAGDAIVSIEDGDHLLAFNGYYRAGRKGSSHKMWTRSAVLQRIQTLAHLISPELSVSVFDAFRTIATQAELYQEFHETIAVDNPTWSEEEITARTKLFVADPYPKNPNDVPAHNTGGAIDLSLFDKNSGIPLDFGSEIDELSDWSRTNFFETEDPAQLKMPLHQWQHIQRNRRILFNGMKSLGFINLPSEWWHFDIGNNHWASIVNSTPIYSSME